MSKINWEGYTPTFQLTFAFAFSLFLSATSFGFLWFVILLFIFWTYKLFFHGLEPFFLNCGLIAASISGFLIGRSLNFPNDPHKSIY